MYKYNLTTVFFTIQNETSNLEKKWKKWKKESRIEENDYGEESEMFLELIFTANEKGKSKHFDQAVLFPPPYLY